MAVLGMWMWPQSIERRGADSVIEVCARAGVTDLFFLAKGLAGSTAFHGRYAPCSCQRDLFREMLEAAHHCGIRVHAWFTSACDAYYKAQHPESGRCHLVRGRDRELISLADEGYLRYMEQILEEFCRNYEIDGLHLDYIRYNHLLYGWAEEDLARYAAAGADTKRLRACMQRMFCAEQKEPELLFDAFRAGDPDAAALAAARRKDVVRFAETLIRAARAEKKTLQISAALMPEGAYEDVAFSDLHYGQNYEDAARLYDFVLPMAYSKAYEKDERWVKTVAEGTLKRGLKTVVGLHAFENGTGPQLLADQNALQGLALEGICLFREGACAVAYAREKALCLYNSLDQPITCTEVKNDSETIRFTDDIAPGLEKEFRLPFEPSQVRIFSGEKEQCLYLAR